MLVRKAKLKIKMTEVTEADYTTGVGGAAVEAAGLTFWIRVILSPFIIILPKVFLLPDFLYTSSASSRTKFIYSSNPTMCPSMRRLMFSYSHTCTLDRFCRYRKIRLMGCTITFWTFGGPLYDILGQYFYKKFTINNEARASNVAGTIARRRTLLFGRWSHWSQTIEGSTQSKMVALS